VKDEGLRSSKDVSAPDEFTIGTYSCQLSDEIVCVALEPVNVRCR
jgi:hypothetical protein